MFLGELQKAGHASQDQRQQDYDGGSVGKMATGCWSDGKSAGKRRLPHHHIAGTRAGPSLGWGMAPLRDMVVTGLLANGHSLALHGGVEAPHVEWPTKAEITLKTGKRTHLEMRLTCVYSRASLHGICGRMRVVFVRHSAHSTLAFAVSCTWQVAKP
jgi:hypothetical protein